MSKQTYSQGANYKHKKKNSTPSNYNGRIYNTIYLEHFKLSSPPFSITPDPAFFVPITQYEEAIAHLLFGLESSGIVVLTGSVGVGKTTTIRKFIKSSPKKTYISSIVATNYSSRDFLHAVCDSFSIPYDLDDDMSIKGMFDLISNFVMDLHNRGKRCLLLIDEAQSLSYDVFETIKTLTNLETDEKKLLQIVLVGVSELNQKLNSMELVSIEQRVIARYHLRNLEKDNIKEYINSRLSVAGGNPNIFSDDALSIIMSITKGSPRSINILCDHCMMAAYAKGFYIVDSSLVNTVYLEQEVNKVQSNVNTHAQRLNVTSTNIALARITGSLLSNKALFAMLGIFLFFISLLVWLMLPFFSDNIDNISIDNTTAIEQLTSRENNSTNDNFVNLEDIQISDISTDGTIDYSEGLAVDRIPSTPKEKLMSLWSDEISYNWPCDVEIADWYCHRINLQNTNSLWVHNIPVLIEWNSEEVALISANENFVTIWQDTQETQISREDFISTWSGTAYMVFPIPANFAYPLRLDDVNDFIYWIDERLSSLEGVNKSQYQNVYNAAFSQRVRSFQEDQRLGGNGRFFGIITYLRLQQLTNTQFIRLSRIE